MYHLLPVIEFIILKNQRALEQCWYYIIRSLILHGVHGMILHSSYTLYVVHSSSMVSYFFFFSREWKQVET